MVRKSTSPDEEESVTFVMFEMILECHGGVVIEGNVQGEHGFQGGEERVRVGILGDE